MYRIFVMFIFCLLAFANDLKITNSFVYNGDQKYAIIDLSWENSWHNKKNHDAVWLFMKLLNGDYGYRHLKISQTGHSWESEDKQRLKLAIRVSDDGSGVMIEPVDTYRGPVHIRLKIMLDESQFSRRFQLSQGAFKAYGIEMVYIPAAPFYVGDAKVDSQYAALFKSDENGKYDRLFKIEAETQAIKIGLEKDNLFYLRRNQYQGDDHIGELGPQFPKGVDDFYVMKYEPKQGQYADFLNSLSVDDSQGHANMSGKTYYRDRGTIRYDGSNYQAEKPDRPNNFMSWDDGAAYADWAALRPMTELEFTKAANGPEKPVSGQYPWGTTSLDKIKRFVDEHGDIGFAGLNESQLDDSNRDQFAASYYWVMDLAGSLWERVVTIGDSVGRSFTGSHGDGQLGDYGFADNADWPYGLRKAAGFGFRGGGYYTDRNAWHHFNPFSPTANRAFGAWSGGTRKNSYGSRYVRSAKTLLK
ncbi:MAG: SUMF1/EgtB/PvdO family nonheme iron enzyme [Calditrichaeota bacterium]|nr:SUMF1/EgtB/PvdO family nonheme iron enzyme [Calditrichota bacterium]